MKNLLFSQLAMFSLLFANTCSVNDEINYQRLVTEDVLTVTINDVEKTFNTLVINQYDSDPDNNVSGLIKIEASIDNLTNEIIKINLFKDVTGTDVIYNIKYFKDDQLYYLDYSSNVDDNDEDDLTLDFYGDIWKLDEESEEKEAEYIFTNGELSVSY